MDDRDFEGRLRARVHREFGAARPSDAFSEHTLEAMRAQISPSSRTPVRRLVAAAAAIVIAVGVVIVRSGATGPAAEPPVSAPAVSSASLLPSAAASPTPTPSPLPSLVDEGMPVVVVDPGAMRSALIPERPTEQAGSAPTGPYAYLLGIADSRYQSLFVADAGGGSERQVPLALLAGEQIDEVVTDEGWIVVAVSRPATPSPTESQLTCAQLERQPRAWRILAAPLDRGGMPALPFARVDAGVASRAFELPQGAGLSCPYPAVPPVAVAADTVAYAVESAPGGASGVVIRSLPTRALLRSYASPSQVYQLVLSSTTVAWSETANGLTDGQTPDWRVMTASTTRGAPRQVPLGVVAGRGHEFPPGLLLDGTAVIASLDQFTGSKGTVVRVDGDQIETIDPGHANRNCWAAGAARGVVVLDCNGTTVNGDTAAMTSWVAVWSAASGLRALGVLTVPAVELWINSGWAVWTGADADQRSVLVGVLLSALR